MDLIGIRVIIITSLLVMAVTVGYFLLCNLYRIELAHSLLHDLKPGLTNLVIDRRETIQEDESGRLEPSVTEIIQRTKRRKLMDREASVRLGIMRHVYIILDYSQSMTEQDFKPTRQICTLKVRFAWTVLQMFLLLLWLVLQESG